MTRDPGEILQMKQENRAVKTGAMKSRVQSRLVLDRMLTAYTNPSAEAVGGAGMGIKHTPDHAADVRQARVLNGRSKAPIHYVRSSLASGGGRRMVAG
jgi:hypothetical protein